VLGTGDLGFSGQGLPALATNINRVTDLVLRNGCEVLAADEGNHLVRALALSWPQATAPSLPQLGGTWQSAGLPQSLPVVAEEVRPMMMPYEGVEWHPEVQQCAALHVTPQLQQDEVRLRFKVSRPDGLVLLSAVPARPVVASSPVPLFDGYVLFAPEWNDRTYVKQLSELWPLEPPRSFLQFLKEFCRSKFEELIKAPEPPQHFFVRNENILEVRVKRQYDSDSDSFTWQIMELKVNGKTRGGELKAFSAGIEVPVVLCLSSDTGSLRLLERPVC